MMKPATAGQNSGKRSCMTPPTTNTGSIGTTSTSSSSCPVPSPVTHFTRCRSGTSACASGVQAVLRQGVQGDARVRCLAVGQEEHARHTCLRLHPFLLQSRCTCRLPARPPPAGSALSPATPVDRIRALLQRPHHSINALWLNQRLVTLQWRQPQGLVKCTLRPMHGLRRAARLPCQSSC
jgi:hypothetical protein